MKKFSRVLCVAVLATACSSDDKSNHDGHTGVTLSVPATGQGVQFQMLSDLKAHVETERCKFFKVPAEGYYVNREEIGFSAGSHHVLLYTTPYTDVPTVDRLGTTVDTSGVFECGPQGPTAHWQVDGVAGGSQVASSKSAVTGLPADTAIHIPGGSVLLMNTHYLNASDQTLTTDARINLYTIPKEAVKREAGVIFFYNPFIRVPGATAGGVGEAREVCPVRGDIELVNSQSHMHKRGVSYQANLLDSTGAEMGELYKSNTWEDVVMTEYAPYKSLKAGQAIDFRCGYKNKEDRNVMQGLATTDEMCMFLGVYFPRDRQFELCGLDNTWDNAFLGARWIGNGSADGAKTAGCFASAQDTDIDQGDSFYGCVTSSCPQISAPMSDAARCLGQRGGPSCKSVCAGDLKKSKGCSDCIGLNCTPSLTVLAAAKCQ